MKIKTREQKLHEYNAKYPEKIIDANERVQRYLSLQKNPDKWIKKAQKKALLIMEEREYESIRITMYEYPMKTDRPRTYKGHTFSPNASANKKYFEAAIRQVIETVKIVNTPAEIMLDVFLEMPSTVPPDEVVLFEAQLLNPVDKPDYDNIGKCYTDMLTNVLISDDDIFWRGEIRKWYSLLPRVEIVIRYLVKHESDYIYKKLKTRKTIKDGVKSGRILLQKIGENNAKINR